MQFLPFPTGGGPWALMVDAETQTMDWFNLGGLTPAADKGPGEPPPAPPLPAGEQGVT